MKTVGIGILGCGTVGSGVAQELQERSSLLAERAGMVLELRRVAVRDLSRSRDVSFEEGVLTDDPRSVVADPSVDIVIELIGGVDLARELVLMALTAGKSVVTANKALLAEHGKELFAVAAENNADLFFEASVAGAVPIIKALREGLAGNQIQRIVGILNGTCNYILTCMEDGGTEFDVALKDAMEMGYAEADPSLDIDGGDTAHKALILAALAYNRFFDQSDIVVDGIRGIALDDLQYAAELGYRIKLLGVILQDGDQIAVRIHPALVPHGRMLASVTGSYNAVMVDGHLSGTTVFHGRGAGREPTTSAVLADVVDVVRNLSSGATGRLPVVDGTADHLSLRPIEDMRVRYYLRMELLDEPGVFAKISECLGSHGISISSVLQKSSVVDGFVPAIIMTHVAPEGAFCAALEELRPMDAVGDEVVSIRVEEFEEAE